MLAGWPFCLCDLDLEYCGRRPLSAALRRILGDPVVGVSGGEVGPAVAAVTAT